MLLKKKFGKGAIFREKEEINHLIILEIPNLIEKLMKLIDFQTFPFKTWSAIVSSLMSNSDSFILSEVIANLEETEENDGNAKLFYCFANFKIQKKKDLRPNSYSLTALSIAMHQVEIIFVLSSLIAGSFKHTVQVIFF